MVQFAAHTLIGRALVAMDRTEEAERELVSARDNLVLIPATEADRLRSYSETLHAEILLSQKKSGEGAALMKDIEEQLRASAGPDARSQALSSSIPSLAVPGRARNGAWPNSPLIK